jgi:L-asparaginase
MQTKSQTVVVLGTGGTIAGLISGSATGHYRAAQLGVQDLVSSAPLAGANTIESEQVAQIDSKDMDFAVWVTLAQRVAWHLARPEVAGVVITHGTDTLEETAFFLRSVLHAHKPVVLTAAMRPADSPEADGPRHLGQAIDVVAAGGWGGVAVALQGEVHDALWVRKAHPRALRAFESGEAGPLAVHEGGAWVWRRNVASTEPLLLWSALPDAAQWPWVELVHSHTGARAQTVEVLVAAGVKGLVVVATGNGTVHQSLQMALQRAQAQGVCVWRTTRCLPVGLVPDASAWCPASELIPSKARVAMLLGLMVPERG